jgi:site-specific DNA-methyltransferase (adenine-specific)
MTTRVITGDCRLVMRNLPAATIGLLLCDPPYGVRYHATRTNKQPNHPARQIIGDERFDEVFYKAWLADAYRLMRPDTHAYVFAADKHVGDVRRLMAEAGFHVRRNLVWNKGSFAPIGDVRGDYGYQCEHIVYAHKGRRELARPRVGNVLTFGRVPSQHMRHPTQKPVALLRVLVEKSLPTGGVVLDPFCGSGSTGVAAAAVKGCSSLLIEADPAYAQIARERLSQPTIDEDDLARAA